MASAKNTKLDDIKQQILADDPTPELRKTATQLVMGDGNPDAELVFIGEAPGKNEDLQGKPFVGAAGKFLNEMLEMIDLKREDVYITNIVKYRPPGNRDPHPDEKQRQDIFTPVSSGLGIVQRRHAPDPDRRFRVDPGYYHEN
jgi:uracil-DNA glycosylase